MNEDVTNIVFEICGEKKINYKFIHTSLFFGFPLIRGLLGLNVLLLD